MSITADRAAPALNEHGVPLAYLLRQERLHHERLEARYREVMECWAAAERCPKNSMARRDLMAKARRLRDRALS